MREEVPGVFKIELSDSRMSIGRIHIYVIPGKPGGRSLMIDAGFGRPQCLEVLKGALGELGVSMDRLDVFLTHKHSDHCGLAYALERLGARLFMNREEDRHSYDCLYYSGGEQARREQERVLAAVGITHEGTPLLWERMRETGGCEEKEWEYDCPRFDSFPAEAGQMFRYGGFQLEAVPLPGHTLGQLGLADHGRRLFFCGDQILNAIVPIVGTSYPGEGILGKYFGSLERIKHTFQGWTVLPAHNGPIEDVGRVVDRIVFSYLDKTYMMQSILKHSRRPMTVLEVACLAYGIPGLPADGAQLVKLKMVVSKTFSCLEYLWDKDFALREEREGTLYWSAP